MFFLCALVYAGREMTANEKSHLKNQVLRSLADKNRN